VHYGPEFLCALLDEQPMGFYPPDALVHEAQRRGLEVRAPDVNRSLVECAVEADLGVRVGIGYVNGARAEEMEAVVAERQRGGPYEGLSDLGSRSGLGREALEKLAWAGALESLGVDAGKGGRRGDLWQAGVAQAGRAQRRQLSLPLEVPPPPPLPELDEWETVVADYASTGMTLGRHPMEVMRSALAATSARSTDLNATPDGAAVEVAGMVVARQRPATAKGVVFMLLEDEVGVINLVVPPPAYERCRLAVRTASFVQAQGKLERREGVINVVVAGLEALATPDAPAASVRQIEPSHERETGRAAAVEMEAVAPRAHSFGRRG
jgi:error-prone DNA polymerase